MNVQIAIALIAAGVIASGAASIVRAGIDDTSMSGSMFGRWLAEDIRGGGVIDNLQSRIDIAEDGTVSGTGGCNAVTGRATISGDVVGFRVHAIGKKLCPPAILDQEAKFLSALNAARHWRTDLATKKLILLDAGGKSVLVFSQI